MIATLWHRHARFLIALALGLAVGALVPLARTDRLLLGADLFASVYLLLAFLHAAGLDPEALRRHGDDDDEGIGLIVAIALASVGLSLWAIVEVLGQRAPGTSAIRPALAVAAVPLGWAMLHTVMAFHYARLHYGKDGHGADVGGLDFPETPAPVMSDFLYFSFTLGMTAQTSDVALRRAHLRRVVLAHSVLSFFYNTGILALTISAAAALIG